MFGAKFYGSWFAYLIISFALGYVWHLVLFKDLYARLAIFSRLDDPIVPLGFISIVVQGAILAYLYPFIAKQDSVMIEGLRFGLLMGVFIASSAVFAEAAKQRVTSLPTWLIVESIYYFIQFCLCGIAIATVHSKLQTRGIL
jgi:lipid-A-disaccharide synthase-like uncharacterized protein